MKYSIFDRSSYEWESGFEVGTPEVVV